MSCHGTKRRILTRFRRFRAPAPMSSYVGREWQVPRGRLPPPPLRRLGRCRAGCSTSRASRPGGCGGAVRVRAAFRGSARRGLRRSRRTWWHAPSSEAHVVDGATSMSTTGRVVAAKWFDGLLLVFAPALESCWWCMCRIVLFRLAPTDGLLVRGRRPLEAALCAARL